MKHGKKTTSVCTRSRTVNRNKTRQTSLHDTMEAQTLQRRSSTTRSFSSHSFAVTSAATSDTKPQASREVVSKSSSDKRPASVGSSLESSNVAASRNAGISLENNDSKPSSSKRRRVTTAAAVSVANGAKSRSSSASKKRGSGSRSHRVVAPLTVTPSPAVFVKKNASGSHDISSTETTPIKVTKGKCQAKRDGDDDGDDDDKRTSDSQASTEVTCTPASMFSSVNRQVTLDTTTAPLAFLAANNTSTPAFHHPWHPPHEADVPKGVIDIDAFPHKCCQNSLNSHAGYSWITSQRRCHCHLDADHCSQDTTLEAYLGTYGLDYYGIGGKIVEEEWKTELWWLDMRKKEHVNLENCKQRKHRRPPSPKSPSEDPFLQPSNLFPFPSSVKDHLNYMDRQSDLNTDMRAILMDWMVEVAEEFRLDSETIHLASTLVDRSLACGYVKKNEVFKGGKKKIFPLVAKDFLQCVGCACTLIASKLLEIRPPTAKDMVYIADNSFNLGQLVEMEREICNHLKYNFNFKTPYNFISRFLRASYASSQSSLAPHRAAMGLGIHNATNALMERLVVYFLDLSMLDYNLVSVKPSLIAASAIYLARASLGIREPLPLFHEEGNSSPSCRRATKGYWSKTLEYYTGHDMWDLEDTVKALRKLQENAATNTLKSIFSKHKSAKYMRVALKTVLNESDLDFF
mmetsp:Transcript_3148/g.6371  ORF Transcript_3148/g.6371 Transcript_3148/m.6371 type:complete len:687 (+) Transcript_3148:237-2297(+)